MKRRTIETRLGCAMVEYNWILALISIVAIAALSLCGPAIAKLFP